jgi:hypothetical protein
MFSWAGLTGKIDRAEIALIRVFYPEKFSHETYLWIEVEFLEIWTSLARNQLCQMKKFHIQNVTSSHLAAIRGRINRRIDKLS